MRTIIISDIRGSAQSIIPYGLNLARAMDSKVVVVHVVDPRINQARYSSYSDSQSITPGEPMGHEESSNKEITMIQTDLDNLLSRETSRVNYPLKVETVVKGGNIEDEIERLIKEETSSLVVVSAEADGAVFGTKEEIFDIIKDSKAMSIIVPPGTEFREYKKILLPVDFDSTELEKFSDLSFFFNAFDPVINAVAVATEDNYSEMDLKSNSWTNVAKDTLLPAKVRANVLKGDDYTETVINYGSRNDFDLIMMFQHKKNLFKNNFKTGIVEAIVEQTNIPTLYFYRK